MSNYPSLSNKTPEIRKESPTIDTIKQPNNSKSVPATFLRSLKVTKPNTSQVVELEEGETISPSPSPRHTNIKTPDISTHSKKDDDALGDRKQNGKTSHRDDPSPSPTRRPSSSVKSESDSSRRRRRSDSKRRDKSLRHYRSRSRSPTQRSRHRSRSRERSKSGRRSPTARSGRSKNSDYRSSKRRRSSIDKKPVPKPIHNDSTKSVGVRQDKPISATAPNADTPEQYKVFTIMFNQLAHANKRRGDGQTDAIFGMIDHFHALCDYILNFYYVDKGSSNKTSFKQASVAWKSLFPFTDSLLTKLDSHKQHDLYGLCARLISLVRYYIYKRMISSTRTLLTKQLTSSDDTTAHTCIEVSEGLLREYEKAEKWYHNSEKYLTYSTMATQFPQTFQSVCVEGNLQAGITLGGEAGVSVEPMFPFTPYSPLHHAAIVSKCMLSEYVNKKKLKYLPISQPEEYMK